ncbi:MAG: flippase-like domain-containing protein [Bacteroidales bacterium]|nr:flippase-like domain-containing protein [Bacteroidales bacterium]
MTPDSTILKKVSPARILLPIILGLLIIGYIIYRDWDSKAVEGFTFTTWVFVFLLFSFVMMLCRDIGYMIRLRILSNGELSWKQIFYIIMLWEFASAVSPSAIGGTAVATYFIYKEKVTLGKSTALVLATAFLDELYFIVVFPIIIFSVGIDSLFSTDGNFSNNYVYFAFIGYALKLIFNIFVAYGLFVNPKSIKHILLKIFNIRFLRKWQSKAEQTGDDIITASQELKHKPIVFWLKAYLASILSWSARYWVVNFLLLGLFAGLNININGISLFEHFEIFARQLVMWVMMLVLPSPGASGFAEAVFSDYLSVFIPAGFVGLLALAWRLVSYYPYLFIGVILLPAWIKRTHKKKTI